MPSHKRNKVQFSNETNETKQLHSLLKMFKIRHEMLLRAEHCCFRLLIYRLFHKSYNETKKTKCYFNAFFGAINETSCTYDVTNK